MDNSRNTIIAVVLMVLVWFAFSIIFPPAPQKPQQPAATVATPSPAVAPAVMIPPATGTPVPAAAPPRAAREIKVETDLYQAVFSTQGGGRLTRLELKNYRAEAGISPLPVELIGGHGDVLATTLHYGGEGDLAFPAEAVFQCDESRSTLKVGGSEQITLRFAYPLADGSLVTREVTVHGQRYLIEQRLRYDNRGTTVKSGRLMAQLREQPLPAAAEPLTLFTTNAAGKLKDDSFKDIEKQEKSFAELPRWSGFKSKYFLRALQPGDSASSLILRKQGGSYEVRLASSHLTVAPGQQALLTLGSYFGPLELEALRAAGNDFEAAVDFGFFAFLAKPFFHILKFFYLYVGNYGYAIVILTILIKLAFWPLTQKSYASMKAMQRLQPEMQTLREKYKNDRERMNREIMQLYQQHRVSPLGGCLPMLVQIPFFFALYQVLMVSIDLRHAPFMLWITDLSVKDPYYVTPLIMGATMFIQQKMTPSQLDPIQQKIFLAMPIVFTFLFLNFPAGLVLYWLVNNLLTILQQYLINRSK